MRARIRDVGFFVDSTSDSGGGDVGGLHGDCHSAANLQDEQRDKVTWVRLRSGSFGGQERWSVGSVERGDGKNGNDGWRELMNMNTRSLSEGRERLRWWKSWWWW